MGLEDRKQFGFCSFYCLLFPFHKKKSMFVVLHSDINSLKSGLRHLTDKKSRSAKVKDGIINLILRNYLIDRYSVSLNFVICCFCFWTIQNFTPEFQTLLNFGNLGLII